MGQDNPTFAEFYRFYLSEHAHPLNRRMHCIGSAGALLAVVAALVSWNPWWLPAGLVFGYGCAWFGHYHYEKNRPATFKYPFYSFLADWVMFRDIINGRLSLRD